MRDLDWKIIATLYTSKSITKTANLLFITQPTLSKRLQLIEEELNTELVIRTSKGVKFTPEGEYVARQAQLILNIIDNIHQNLSNSTGGKKGTLHIGAPNSYTRFVLPPLIAQYARLYPDVRLEITTALSSQIPKLVDDRSVQVGFMRSNHGSIPSGLTRIMLSEDQIYIVSSQPIQLEQLPDLPQIDYVKEPSIIEDTAVWWKQHFDRGPTVRMKVNHGDTCLAMIRQGLGYAIFSDDHFFRDDPNLFRMPLIHADGTPFTRKTYLIYSRDSQSSLITNFIEFIKTVDFQNL